MLLYSNRCVFVYYLLSLFFFVSSKHFPHYFLICLLGLRFFPSQNELLSHQAQSQSIIHSSTIKNHCALRAIGLSPLHSHRYLQTNTPFYISTRLIHFHLFLRVIAPIFQIQLWIIKILGLRLERSQHMQRAQQIAVHAEHRSRVGQHASIIGRGEDGEQSRVREELVPIVHDLVRSTDQIQVELLEEIEHHFLGERVAHAPLVRTPPLRLVALGVRPEQVADQALVGNVVGTLDRGDVGDGANVGRETSVRAEDPSSDKSTERKVTKAFGKTSIEVRTVTPVAFLAKPVQLIHCVRFVISAKQEHFVWVLHFQGKEQT